MPYIYTERDRETERETERDRERETDRQRDRDRDREADRQTEKKRRVKAVDGKINTPNTMTPGKSGLSEGGGHLVLPSGLN